MVHKSYPLSPANRNRGSNLCCLYSENWGGWSLWIKNPGLALIADCDVVNAWMMRTDFHFIDFLPKHSMLYCEKGAFGSNMGKVAVV